MIVHLLNTPSSLKLPGTVHFQKELERRRISHNCVHLVHDVFSECHSLCLVLLITVKVRLLTQSVINTIFLPLLFVFHTSQVTVFYL